MRKIRFMSRAVALLRSRGARSTTGECADGQAAARSGAAPSGDGTAVRSPIQPDLLPAPSLFEAPGPFVDEGDGGAALAEFEAEAASQQSEAPEMFSVDASGGERREGPTQRAIGWRIGDMETNNETMEIRRATTLGQMPHGRWQTYIEAGGSAGS